jgi:hypothetical protein
MPISDQYWERIAPWALRTLIDELRHPEIIPQLREPALSESLEHFAFDERDQLAHQLILRRARGPAANLPLEQRFRDLYRSLGATQFPVPWGAMDRTAAMQAVQSAFGNFFPGPARKVSRFERAYPERIGAVVLTTSIEVTSRSTELRYFQEIRSDEGAREVYLESILNMWSINAETHWCLSTEEDIRQAVECCKDCISLFRDAKPWEA